MRGQFESDGGFFKTSPGGRLQGMTVEVVIQSALIVILSAAKNPPSRLAFPARV